jgi:sulfate adenylyltransferase subunit 1 (EFTu-like GTPase family)
VRLEADQDQLNRYNLGSMLSARYLCGTSTAMWVAIVIDAQVGLASQRIRSGIAEDLHLPVFFVVNKLDRERASRRHVVQA